MVILAKVEKAEQVKGIYCQRLVIKAESKVVVSVQCMSPCQFVVDDQSLRFFISDLFKKLDRLSVIAIQSVSNCEFKFGIRA